MPVFLKWIGIFFNTKKERKGSVGGKGGQDIGRERQRKTERSNLWRKNLHGAHFFHTSINSPHAWGSHHLQSELSCAGWKRSALRQLHVNFPKEKKNRQRRT